jgi:hypothetical protein
MMFFLANSYFEMLPGIILNKFLLQVIHLKNPYFDLWVHFVGKSLYSQNQYSKHCYF